MSGATGARIAHLASLVRDDDEAIAGLTGKRDFVLVGDSPLGDAWRWVRVIPRGGGCELLRACAADPAQATGVGRQGAGRVLPFLATDDFQRDSAAFRERGVRFLEAPARNPTARSPCSRTTAATAGT
jgi:hypothetical protein